MQAMAEKLSLHNACPVILKTAQERVFWGSRALFVTNIQYIFVPIEINVNCSVL